MYIQCPACKTRAQIPESQEGAKVRCGSCSRVYIARAPGAKGAAQQSSNGRTIAIIGGAVVVTAFAAFVYNRGKSSAAQTPVVVEEVQAERGPAVDYVGWDSVPVKAVRDLYASTRSFDKARIEKLIDVPSLWAAGLAEAQPATPERSPDEFALLAGVDKLLATDAMVEFLLNDESENALRLWNPVDGQVLDEDEDALELHVQVDKLDVSDGLESRTMAFVLVRDPKQEGAYRVAGWERFITAEEERAVARAPKSYAKVELSDGSKVYEAQPRALEHLEDTPPELRAEIDQAYATMIDLDLTREATQARQRLVEIGKPAIPVLLTGLYEIPLDTMDQAIQVNQICRALRDITGEYHGYEPMELAGSTVGTTRERRESSIKQWFAWWERKGRGFEAREEPEGDPLEDLIELNEREKRLLERDQRSGG